MGSEQLENYGGLGYYNTTPQKDVPTSSVLEAEQSLKKVSLEQPPLAYPLSGADAPVAGYPVIMGEGPALREGGAMTPAIHEITRLIGGRFARRAERRVLRREYRIERRSNRREYRSEIRHSRLEGIGAIVSTVIDAVKFKKPKKD